MNYLTRKQRRGLCRVFVVRHLEILVTANQLEKVFQRCVFTLVLDIEFIKTEKTVYFLLIGGSKSSQNKDIAQAKKMARELKKG